MTPTIDRRSFLGSLGAAAVASTLPRPLKAFLVAAEPPSVTRVPRVAVLAERGFPTIDASVLEPRTLRDALRGLAASYLEVGELERLDPSAFDVFLNPYGSAFPKPAWPQFHDFLTAGGNWVNVGGVPFAVPVRREAEGWQPEVRQSAYHKQLGITQAFPVDVSGPHSYRPNPDIEWTDELAGEISAETVYELYCRFTREPEFPDEDGSSGPRDALLVPLISVMGGDEHPLAVPIVCIDRLLGPFAGGRWLLADFNGSLSAAALRALLEHAAVGAHALVAQPSFACYQDGETPAITVTLKSPAGHRASDLTCRVEIFDEGNRSIAVTTLPLHGTGFVVAGTVTLKTADPVGLAPGLYRVEATLEKEDETFSGLGARTGFWIFDRELLASGDLFTTDAHTLLRHGEPYVVTGTSYMASDVHRKFLFEPNPYVWDRDFAAMKRAGVNMIRTGIWTGWKNYMLDVGAPNEAALRALDAFLLTARRYDIPVIFTFFAFLPEMWGGANPYLDPRAVGAQKTFLSLVVRRYREMNDVIWDLINEPSFCSPERLWLTRPNYDRYELRAWHDWLRQRFPARSDAERQARLAELWRTLPNEAMALPRPEEFSDRNIFEGNRPLKVMEYRLFANDMFTRWAREMIAALREAGNPRQLVTVGQDEGGTYERPGPMFHGSAVDFTSNHTWWLNDNLLWDHVMTKTPDRPNLISETGIMFYERIDGSAWRTEEEARDLLERKLALALAVGGAGFIEWIWNTNPYMPLDNEAAIGLLRTDGSAKPELHVFRDMARFAAQSLRDLGPREREPALMVIPHSHMFSVRNFASEATQRAVRTLHYSCGVTMSGVSEYGLDRLDYIPQLIILPSPRILTETAWQRLLVLADDGATLLVTGPIDSDEHWFPVPRLERFGVTTSTRPVAQEENLELDGELLRLSYRGEKIQRLETAVANGGEPARVMTIRTGRGRLIWSPLPVELAQQVEPTAALYRYALAQAELAPHFATQRLDPGVLIYPAVYRNAVLYTVVSELGGPTSVRFTHGETSTAVEVRLPPGRAALILLDRRDGRVLGRYEGRHASRSSR
jgi:hypothetical protein